MTTEEQILQNTETIINLLTQTEEEELPAETDKITQYKQEIQDLLDNGTSVDQLIQLIIQQLEQQAIYDQNNVLIQLYNDDNTNNTLLSFKMKPYNKMGTLIQYLYDVYGEPDHFQTTRYNMRIIIEYKFQTLLTQNPEGDTIPEETSIENND